jgi:hypothetical protein
MGYGMGYGYGTGYGYMGFQPAVPMPASVQYQYYGGMDPYDWAVCHAGSWMPYRGGYAWVVGRRVHHHPPVHWIHIGRTVAAVPIHPRDVKGKPPVNRQVGFVAEKGKQGFKVTPVKFDGSRPVELMKEAPRQFRNEQAPKLARAEAPHMEAHALREMAPGRPGMARSTGVPLTFNRQQGFMAQRQVMQGGRTVSMNTPVGRSGAMYAGHGAAPAGFGAGGGFHGGGGGGFHGGASGGFHGGGASSGGGGMAHGGPVSGGSMGSVSSAGSGASAPSGGSHK